MVQLALWVQLIYDLCIYSENTTFHLNNIEKTVFFPSIYFFNRQFGPFHHCFFYIFLDFPNFILVHIFSAIWRYTEINDMIYSDLV